MNAPTHAPIPHPATVAFLASLSLWGAPTALAASCRLDHSVFRDSGDQGFALSFSESNSPLAYVTAKAHITHPLRGTLFKFELGRTNGCGANYLIQTRLPGAENAEMYKR